MLRLEDIRPKTCTYQKKVVPLHDFFALARTGERVHTFITA